MSLGKEQEKFMKDVQKLLSFIHSLGFDIRGGELFRTAEQQKIYVKDGKSETFNSNHLKKCAIDLFIFKDGTWIKSKSMLQKIGDFWESLNTKNRWGGNYKSFYDGVHFERRVA